MFRINRPRLLTSIVSTLGAWDIVKRMFIIRNRGLWKDMLDNSSAVLLYFDSFKEELNDLFKVSSNKIKTIANPSPFGARANVTDVNQRIVYIGRIEENQKRIDILLELWKRLHEDFPNWDFDLVGDGSYLSKVHSYIAENNLDRITVHGKKDSLPFWDNTDVFTLTSDFEGFGMVLIEAQSRGVVPVAFRCFSAIDKIIENGRTGFVIDDYNFEEMYTKTASLLKDKEMLLRFKKHAIKQTDFFQKEKIASQYKELFVSVLS